MFNFFKKINNKQKIDYVVVGLGNPGNKYKNTRHNAGFIAIDHIIKELHAVSKNMKFNAKIFEATLESMRVLLVKPQTYMNLSGDAVIQIANFYKIPIEKFIVISDDISLPVGKLRIRKTGSAGGHNGLKDIITKANSEHFLRIKMGIGAKPVKWNLSDWVLSEFTASERSLIDSAAEKAHLSLTLILQHKANEAMNKFNS